MSSAAGAGRPRPRGGHDVGAQPLDECHGLLGEGQDDNRPDAELGVRARLLDEPLGVAPYERLAHAEDRGGDLAGVAASCAQWPRSTSSLVLLYINKATY